MAPEFTHDELSFLELADSVSNDEFGNYAYVFNRASGNVHLAISTLDGDVSIQVFIPSQSTPIVDLELVGCETIHCVNDKRGVYFEVIGQHRIEQYNRGNIAQSAGFKLQLAPELSIEPFYRAENANEQNSDWTCAQQVASNELSMRH